MEAIDTFETGMSILFNEPEVNSGHYGESQTIYFQNLQPIKVILPDVDSKNVYLFAHHIWKSSILLSKLIIEDPTIVKNKRVLELGAGSGVPSIVCNLMGARDVVCSDYPDEDILSKLKLNMKLNNVQVETIGHVWGDEKNPFVSTFDVIIMADTLWMTDQHDSLLKDLDRFLANDGIVRGTAGLHSGKDAMDIFFEKAGKKFKVEELIPIRIPIGNGFCENSDWNVELGSVSNDIQKRNRHIFKFKLIRKVLENKFNI